MKKNGFTLIEVLVSMLILAIGFLGVAALQVNALKNNQSSLQRTQASTLAYFMMDQMRANREIAIDSGYKTGGMKCAATAVSGITNVLAANDIANWFTVLKQNIANNDETCGEIACVGNSCRVTVQWNDTRGREGIAAQKIEVKSIL